MKVLTDAKHAELSGQANAFNQIVTALLESADSDIKAEDITAEFIIEAVQANDEGAEVTDLRPDLDAANTRVTELEGQLETANARVAELEAEIDRLPAEPPASISSSAEKGGEKQDLVDYAKKNQDSPLAVIEHAKKEGFI